MASKKLSMSVVWFFLARAVRCCMSEVSSSVFLMVRGFFWCCVLGIEVNSLFSDLML